MHNDKFYHNQCDIFKFITTECKHINQNESQASIEDIKIYYIY